MSKTDAIIKAQPIRFFDEFDTELIDETDLAQFAVLYKTTDLIKFQTKQVNELWYNQKFTDNNKPSNLTNWSQYNSGVDSSWSVSLCSGDNSFTVSKSSGSNSTVLYQQLELTNGSWYRFKIDVCAFSTSDLDLEIQTSANGAAGGWTERAAITINTTGELETFFQWTGGTGAVDVGFQLTSAGTATALQMTRVRLQEIDMILVKCSDESEIAITAETMDENYITFEINALTENLEENKPYYFNSNTSAGIGKSVQFIITDEKFYQMQFSHTGDGVFGLKWSDISSSTLTFGFKKLQVGQAVFENEDGQTYQNSSEQWRNLYSQINKKVTIATDVVPWYVHECLAYLTNVNNFTIELNGDSRRFVKTADEYSPNYNGYEQAAVSFTCYEAAQSTGIVKNSGNI